jgi:hypothetical protein
MRILSIKMGKGGIHIPDSIPQPSKGIRVSAQALGQVSCDNLSEAT